jgi:hypothetical protein
MSSSITSPDTRPRATEAMVDGERLRVSLTDGRDVSIPTSWYAWLHDATAEQQADLAIIEGGLGIWWEQLHDGLSVPGLLGQPHV